MSSAVTLEKITALAKRRGFIFPSSEIYGGLANVYDFGPLGVELKNNIKKLWWERFVHKREDMVGLDASILMNSKVWEASGHVSSFSDPMIECDNCHARFRADRFPAPEDKLFVEKWVDSYRSVKGMGDPDDLSKAERAHILSKQISITQCPNCNENRGYSDPREFNLMFKTQIGVTSDSKIDTYLRPETAQAIFVNFKNIIDTSRKTLPFGVAQIGKAFRNEITTGYFIFRMLEFEQMEIEYFIREEDWEKTFDHWQQEIMKWTAAIGIKDSSVRFREHDEKERSHYSKRTVDLEYNYSGDFKELYGLAYRGSYDLTQHGLNYADQATGEQFIPHVIEPSFGLERTILAILIDAYYEEEKRVVLKLKPSIAPFKAAVFPLVQNKEDIVTKARSVHSMLIEDGIYAAWDDRGNIGKRYLSQDEIGTPFCITIDYDTLDDAAVTVRDRDSMQQERVAIEKLSDYIKERI